MSPIQQVEPVLKDRMATRSNRASILRYRAYYDEAIGAYIEAEQILTEIDTDDSRLDIRSRLTWRLGDGRVVTSNRPVVTLLTGAKTRQPSRSDTRFKKRG